MDWVPYIDGFRTVAKDNGSVVIRWRGDSGGRNATERLRLSQDGAETLHEELDDVLAELQNDE